MLILQITILRVTNSHLSLREVDIRFSYGLAKCLICREQYGIKPFRLCGHHECFLEDVNESHFQRPCQDDRK